MPIEVIIFLPGFIYGVLAGLCIFPLLIALYGLWYWRKINDTK